MTIQDYCLQKFTATCGEQVVVIRDWDGNRIFPSSPVKEIKQPIILDGRKISLASASPILGNCKFSWV